MYQALYREYRPKTFDDVLGQEHITTTLKNQIKNGNVSHAYLFAGTKGTGKTSTAKIFSRAVNCLESEDGNPCNKCENCLGILNETVMDVIEMDAASNRKIEDIRDLKDKVVYPPSQTQYKIYIIDEVHMLTNEAFNALLKTLEEPPKHLIFILATTEMEKLPQTILSRCQRFDFKRITTDNIVYNMEKILKDKDVKVEDRALKLIARNSDGAMRDALSLLDQCIAYKKVVNYEDAMDILGIANSSLLFELGNDISNKNIDDLLIKVDEIIQNGKDINQFIKDLILHFRNLLMVKSSNASLEVIDMDEESFKDYKNQSENLDIDFILYALDILTEAENKAKWSSQPRVILEMSLIKLTKLKEDMNLLERVKVLEDQIKFGKIEVIPRDNLEKVKKTVSNKTPKAKEVKEPKEEVKPNKTSEVKEKKEASLGKLNIDEETLKDRWDEIKNSIKKESVKLYAFLTEGIFYSFENDLITIIYPSQYGFHREAISKEDNKEEVRKIISNILGGEIEIKFMMEDELPKVVNKENEKAKEDIKSFFGDDIVEIK